MNEAFFWGIVTGIVGLLILVALVPSSTRGRTIIAIGQSPDIDGTPDLTVACSDGSLWTLGRDRWLRLPDVPKEDKR